MKILQTAIVCAIALGTWGCTPSDMSTAERVALANPASVNCVKLGGKLTIKRTSQGDVGMCHLPTGKVCEEWALYRGQCL